LLVFTRSPRTPYPPSFPTRRSSDLREVPRDPRRLLRELIDRDWRACISRARPDMTSSPFQLLANVSHELRTPLVSIKGYNELILDRKSTRLNSSHGSISYAVFCLKK